jgi:prevent-host-death family protein
MPTIRELSVTDANRRGVAGLFADAERGARFIVTRHSRPIAAVVGIDEFRGVEGIREDLRDLALVLARQATDTGSRTAIDDALAAFGHTRESLAEPPD